MHLAIDPLDLDPPARHRLTIGTIVPRPIAWTTSVSPEGHLNLAPFSYFMGCHSYEPALAISVGSRDGAPKDTRYNISASGEFVVNLVTDDLAERMNVTAAAFPPEVNELHVAGLTTVPSVKIAPPRIGESPIAMECEVLHAIDLGEPPRLSTLFVGRIVMWHVRHDLVDDDYRVRQDALELIARMGGPFYTRTSEIFRMDIPDWRTIPLPETDRARLEDRPPADE